MKYEEILYANRLMRTSEEVRAFDSAVLKAGEIGPQGLVLSSLLSAFDDATKHEEVMFGLVHLVEQFETQSRVKELLAVSTQMSERAAEWLRILLIGNLNHPASSAELEKLLRREPDKFPAIALALEKLAAGEDALAARAKAMRSVLT